MNNFRYRKCIEMGMPTLTIESDRLLKTLCQNLVLKIYPHERDLAKELIDKGYAVDKGSDRLGFNINVLEN